MLYWLFVAIVLAYHAIKAIIEFPKEWRALMEEEAEKKKQLEDYKRFIDHNFGHNRD